jgi:hypothetical protein
MNAKITHDRLTRESGIRLELPKEVLAAIRNDGLYHEVTIDPASDKILAQVHLAGSYDSYSDIYQLNGERWKIAGHRSWPSGQDTYVMKLEEHYAKSRR